MKLGIMGGTFDPIHLGHLRAAENARESRALDAVAFIPCGKPPHRPEPESPALDRYAMVCLATAGHARFRALDVEIRREGPSYTVDTLTLLREGRPEDEFVLILGQDAFADLGKWKDSARLLSLCSIAVVARPRSGEREDRPDVGAGDLVDGPGLAISSSAIRKRVAARKSVRYLVPDAVAEYIDKRGLYQ